MPPRIDPEQVASWAALARRLEAAAHGDRAALIADAAAAHGISRHTVYKRLVTYGGWTSGRAPRAGTSTVDDAVLTTVAGIYKEGRRENKKQVMTIDLACSIAEQSGHAIPVSNAQVGRLLRQQRMDRRGQDLAQHFGAMRSPHPNYAHQFDPSLCLIYYMNGRQHLIRESEWYRNKLDKVAKIDTKVWRYVLTDHASSLDLVRYYEARGESQALLFDFLMWAWERQPGRTGHGVPRYLIMDPGSANTAHGIIRLLQDALDVTPIVHRPEQPHVKGQVECAQNLIERHFESRLRFSPIHGIDDLNARAAAWNEAWNTNSLPRIDSRLRRPGAAPAVRAELWMRIRPEQLRELPAREACAKLLEGKPIERTIDGYTQISYRHPAAERSLTYSLKHLEGPHRGDKVEVSPLLIAVDGSRLAIRLRWRGLDGVEQTWRLEPVTDLDEFGQSAAAPAWGDYAGQPKREAQRTAEALARAAYPEQTAAARDPLEARRKARMKQVVPFGGQLDALAHLDKIETPTYLPRVGAAITVEVPEDRREAVPLVRALLRLSQTWGRPLTDGEHDWIASRFGTSVPADELDRLLAAGTAGDTPAPVAAEAGRPGLAVVR